MEQEGAGYRDTLCGRMNKARKCRNILMSVDTGMVIVIFISLMYLVLVFGLLFYVENEWCDLLFKNMTVREAFIKKNGQIS